MATLREIYRHYENPFSDTNLMNGLINCYTNNQNILEYLTQYGQTKDNSIVNANEREQYFVNKFNDIFKQFLIFAESNRRSFDDVQEFDNFVEWVKYYQPLGNFEQLNYLFNHPAFNELNRRFIWDSNLFFQAQNSATMWEYCKSANCLNYFDEAYSNPNNILHRIYINPSNDVVYLLADIFRKKCVEQNLPFYFKLPINSDKLTRADKFVVYVDDTHFEATLNILETIKQQYPHIFTSCGKPPALTQCHDEHFGIGDEPDVLRQNGTLYSFNSIRAEIIYDAISEANFFMLDYYQKQPFVNFEGKQIPFQELINSRFAHFLAVNNPEYTKVFKFKKKKILTNIYNELLATDVLNKFINSYPFNIKQIKLDNSIIATLNTEIGRFAITPNLLFDFVTSFSQIMASLDKYYTNTVFRCIGSKALEKGVDNQSFCFNSSTRQRMIQMQREELRREAPPSGVTV